MSSPRGGILQHFFNLQDIPKTYVADQHEKEWTVLVVSTAQHFQLAAWFSLMKC